MNPISILPSNATPWGNAHELTDAARWQALDPSIITKVKDALLCEPQFLALLGWERSVDLWFDDWSEQKRRHVVDRWFHYERLKGTVEGYRQFVALAGARVVHTTLPPQGHYMAGDWTDDQRRVWLAQFQQIRIYPYRPVTEFAYGFYPCEHLESGAYWDEDFFEPYNTAVDGVIREARLYDPDTGQETVLTRREHVVHQIHVGDVYEFEDIVLPMVDDGFYFDDSYFDEDFVGVDNAPERVIRAGIARPLGVALTMPQYSAFVPEGRLTSVHPELVRETFVDHGSFYDEFFYGPFDEEFYGIDLAWNHVYEVFYVYDRQHDHDLTAGEPASYYGYSYYGWMPFTAELKVEIRGRIDPDDACEWVGGYYLPDDMTVLDRTLQAVRAAKPARDTIYLETRTRRPRRLGDHFRLGDGVKLGALVET